MIDRRLAGARLCFFRVFVTNRVDSLSRIIPAIELIYPGRKVSSGRQPHETPAQHVTCHSDCKDKALVVLKEAVDRVDPENVELKLRRKLIIDPGRRPDLSCTALSNPIAAYTTLLTTRRQDWRYHQLFAVPYLQYSTFQPDPHRARS